MPDDNTCRAIAEDIERQRPEWLVVWGGYSKQFVAFPLFPVTQHTIVTAHYPDALVARMDEAERTRRLRLEQEGNQA